MRLQAISRRLFSTHATDMPTAVIPKTGQQVSRIGFGAYRAVAGNPTHAAALCDAFKSGINIIDTAANFENGASESLIGETIETLESLSEIKRNSLTIVSKSGYLQAKDVEQFSNQDYATINDKSFHSISPRIIEGQIQDSLKRLRTNKIDIFMINAPERMLTAKNKHYTQEHLYRELEQTFRYLDTQVSHGVIGGYGVCSNTMALSSAVDHFSLKKALEVCPNPANFVAVQVPFNVYEKEAAVNNRSAFTSPEQTVSQIAEENGIYVMTNRPLNAIANGEIRVLVNHILGGTDDSSAGERQIMESMSQSFQKVTEMETDLMSELPIEEEALTAKFIWGQALSENLGRLSKNHFATRHYLTKQVLPALEKDLKSLAEYAEHQAPEKVAAFDDWIAHYRESVQALAKDIVNYAYIDTLRKNNDLDRILCALSPSLNKQEDKDAYSPLTVRILRFLLAHQDIGTVFTGMRDPLYVKDAVMAANLSVHEPLSQQDISDIWQCPIFE